MIIADLILIITTLIALIFTSITDLKTKEVPDFISYSLIISSLSIRLIYSFLFSSPYYFLYGLLGLASTFIIGNILYHLKQWGGGDSKLMMGIGSSLATTPYYLSESKLPFLLVIFIYILIAGTIYSLSWSIYYLIKDYKGFKKEYKLLKKSKLAKTLNLSSYLLTFLFIILIFILNNLKVKLFLFFLIFLILIYPRLYTIIKAIENIHLYTLLPINKVVEGDWVVREVKKDEKIVFEKRSIITKKDIEKLKELGIKQVLVKDGIPFVPPFLLGTTIALIFGSPI